MIPIACGCSKNRTTASGAATVSGTYRVMVGDRKVYETTNETAADTVAARFSDARILAPGESA